MRPALVDGYIQEKTEKFFISSAPCEPFTTDWRIYRVRISFYPYRNSEPRYSNDQEELMKLAAPGLLMKGDSRLQWHQDYVEYVKDVGSGWYEVKIVKAYLD
jgi:hypothetical protein